jgi:Cft2 family RNA processing exonuclease
MRLGPYRVLLDCGLRDLSPFTSSRRQPQRTQPPADVVLCSHAHPDHARGLLSLHQTFPQLPIYASEVTAHLLPLNWPELPIRKRTQFCQALPWRSPIEFGDGLTAELFPVGHLPGAAAFLLSYTPPYSTRPYRVFYTGDFFLSNSRLVEGLPLEELRGLSPDVLIVESSFGTSRHPHRRQQENQLAERISQAIKQGINVILPVPVLGLGQELLMLLRSHHYFTGQNVDIWVEEAIAKGCDAYLEIVPHLPSSVRNFAQHQSLFWDQRVKPRVQRLPAEQRSQLGESACIILTDEQVNLRDYVGKQVDLVSQGKGGNDSAWLLLLPRQSSTIAQTGTISPDFLGDILTEFAEEIQTGQFMVDTYLLAEHSDGPGTTQLIHNLRPQHVLFVHGNPTYLADLTGLEELRNRYHLHYPTAGIGLELPIGDKILPNATPEANPGYEGEVTELETTITVNLPTKITEDPRWRAFADTGLITAIWQGDELLLRGISPRELLLERGQLAGPTLMCCATCQFCRSQRCWNQASALYGLKVSPEGYCPAYAPNSDPDSPS